MNSVLRPRLYHLQTVARWKFLFSILILFSSMCLAKPCDNAHSIIQKPINFNETRIHLTQKYSEEHYGIHSKSITIDPKMIVLHWTGTKTHLAAFQTFNPPQLGASRPELPGNLNVSAHFLVDHDGTIYQLMPDNWMARHVIGLNHTAIGIENVGGVKGKADLTQAQVTSNAFLVCYLKKKYPHIQYLIGHMEYLQFRNHPLWMEKNPNYITYKGDPGQDFMKKVRNLTQPLGLHAKP